MIEVCEPMVGGVVSPFQENLLSIAGSAFDQGDKGDIRPRPRPLPPMPQPPRPPR